MNISKNILRMVLCLGIALPAMPGYAEDIDIYSRPDSTTSTAQNPNILIVIDNSTNWSANNQHWPGGIKQGEAELEAVRNAVSILGADTNVGLMMFTAGSTSGGYVRFHIRPMNTTNKSALLELIGDQTCVNSANSLNGTPNCIRKNYKKESIGSGKLDYSAAMLEVFKYFGGYTEPANSQNDTAGANVNASQFGTLRYAGDLVADGPAKFDAAAYTDVDKTNYNPPLSTANGCAKNYVIFVGNGFPSSDSDSTLLGPPSLLPTTGVGGDVTQLPLANLDEQTNPIEVLLTTPGCGTYPSATPPDSQLGSKNACSAKASQTFTVTSANPAVITATGHGLVNTDAIQLFTADSLPSNFATATTYYVIAAGMNDFQLSETLGGSAISGTTGSNIGPHTFSSIAVGFPGYETYSCENAATCEADGTTTTTTLLATSACAVYADVAACEAAMPAIYDPDYTSYTCTNELECEGTSDNTSNPIDADTGCISDNLNKAAVCQHYGDDHYPAYSGFTCTSIANCGGGDKQWQIDAAFNVISGFTYSMNGLVTETVDTKSWSQHIYGKYDATSAQPDGTFSAPTASNTNYFDEWARFLNQTDVSSVTGKQNVSTFTIDVFKDAQDTDETSLLISAAKAGGGKYFQASNKDAILNALNKIFSEIQSVNSVFASSSLPVSVNTQGTYLNQVFMGMFRPEGGASPRWPGNLKQYKFKVFNNELLLSDKNGDEAINSVTGFVTPCADSFWSTDTGQYWNYGQSQSIGGCTAQDSAFPVAGSTSIYSDGPDGEVVEKGGAAQRLRGAYSSGGTLVSSSTNYADCGAGTPATAACRLLKTCDGSSVTSCTSLTAFETSNAAIDYTALNLPDNTERDNLIWWIRGKDVDNENDNLDGIPAPIVDEMRPSVHGGVVHSQPAVIDFGGTTGSVAFYGSDDGVFHAVKSGQDDTDGYEMWGFIAPETMGKLRRLRENSPLVAFPGVTGSPPPTQKDYFFDGSIGVHQDTSTDPDTIWIYPSMRRGGRAIYAFDVSDPAAPVLKWRKGCFTNDTTDDSVCSTGWTGIGQTWSQPKVVKLAGYTNPVLTFGGGYDTCEDTNSQTRCTGTIKGASIWFVDAITGVVLRTYPTHYSVPGDLALIKTLEGTLTHLYAADTGGNVYRINVGSTDGATFTGWTDNSAATDIILASLSETDHARKFINGPSVVPGADFNAVLIGSGDREHPLVDDYSCTDYSTTDGEFVTNQFYMLIDTPNAYLGAAVTPGDLVDVTLGDTTTETAAGVTTVTNDLNGTSTFGWRFDFGQCEQTVNKALTIAGTTFFGTNSPDPSGGTSCSADLGTARGYAVDYLTGTATGTNRSAAFVGGGMPPSPVAGIVQVGTKKYPFCIGCINTDSTSASALQGSEIEIELKSGRYRPFWYIESD